MKDKKGLFIPVNEVPNYEELIGKVQDSKVTEMTGSEQAIPDKSREASAFDTHVDFVWGFLFFEEPLVYAQGNKIFFNGEVTKQSVNVLKSTLINTGRNVMSMYNELGVYNTSSMFIELHINSPGGCMYSGWDLIDFMQKFYIPIHTVGTGTVASMAVNVLLAGKVKRLTKNTHILIHQFRAGVRGKRQDIMDYMKHFEKIQTQTVSYISANTKLSVEKVSELLQNETWLNAEESIEMGIGDSIY